MPQATAAARLSGIGRSLVILGRALRRPRAYAATGSWIRGLAAEFAAGGVVVETDGIRSVVQVDGDVQVCLGPAFRSSTQQEQASALDAHFEAVQGTLRPLAGAGEFATLARAAPGALAGLTGGGTELARFFAGDLTSIAFWLPHILTAMFLLAALFAPRLGWWFIRRRIILLSATRPGGGATRPSAQRT